MLQFECESVVYYSLCIALGFGRGLCCLFLLYFVNKITETQDVVYKFEYFRF